MWLVVIVKVTDCAIIGRAWRSYKLILMCLPRIANTKLNCNDSVALTDAREILTPDVSNTFKIFQVYIVCELTRTIEKIENQMQEEDGRGMTKVIERGVCCIDDYCIHCM